MEGVSLGVGSKVHINELAKSGTIICIGITIPAGDELFGVQLDEHHSTENRLYLVNLSQIQADIGCPEIDDSTQLEVPLPKGEASSGEQEDFISKPQGISTPVSTVRQLTYEDLTESNNSKYDSLQSQPQWQEETEQETDSIAEPNLQSKLDLKLDECNPTDKICRERIYNWMLKTKKATQEIDSFRQSFAHKYMPFELAQALYWMYKDDITTEKIDEEEFIKNLFGMIRGVPTIEQFLKSFDQEFKNFQLDNNKRPRAGGIIFDCSRKFMLLLAPPSSNSLFSWSVPKSKLKFGETLQSDGLKRALKEIEEEVSLPVELNENDFIVESVENKENMLIDFQLYFVVQRFCLENLVIKPKSLEEVKQAKWFSIKHLFNSFRCGTVPEGFQKGAWKSLKPFMKAIKHRSEEEIKMLEGMVKEGTYQVKVEQVNPDAGTGSYATSIKKKDTKDVKYTGSR